MEEIINGKNITIGVLLILSALAGMGGSILLEPEQYENAYLCDVTEKVGVFLGGISGTAYTGYPHAEDRTDPARCNVEYDGQVHKGKWVDLKEYAEEQGVDPLTFLAGQESKVVVIKEEGTIEVVEVVNNDLVPSSKSGDYCCSTERCVVGAC